MLGEKLRRDLLVAGTAATLLALLACAPRALRGGEGTDNPRMDEPALSTTLDREDINYLVKENLSPMFDSAFWSREVHPAAAVPVFAIWPIENRTTQHLGDQMLTLLSSLETALVQSGEVQVVARSRQEELAEELGIQQGATYDAARARQLGRQVGAQYFLTGKITSVDEKLSGTRRVQYSLFIQVIELETGLVKFQNEATRSKALKG
jgi:PBP1b-binding outer membrane lipoprotein LpoB